MKKTVLRGLRFSMTSLVLVGLCLSIPADAGTVAGTGGSTEITQILNNLQLVQSYEQQVQGYIRQGLQVENELKNLMANPASVLGTDVGQVINTIGSIMNGGQSIGWNLAQIDKNFAATYKSKLAGNLSTAFTQWHQTNTDTLQAVLKSVGAQRDSYASNQAALTNLYKHSQETNGALDSLQTLSQINVRQIQQLQSLQELMANQTTAEATYMATQTAKDQQMNAAQSGYVQPYNPNLPDDKTAPSPKWKQ